LLYFYRCLFIAGKTKHLNFAFSTKIKLATMAPLNGDVMVRIANESKLGCVCSPLALRVP
jgi:hypothetical protein